jgi:(2Fe-2S) ferredoxin
MEPFRQHVFVCTQGKPEGVASCPSQGSLRVLQALERELDTQGLGHQVQVTTCGCLGLCENGPAMITYPEGTWYRKVKEEDIPEFVDSHLRSGKVVSRLVWNDGPAMKAEITESRNHYRAVVQAKDEAGTLPDSLNEIIRSFMPSRAVLTALELDVFTAVASGASAKQTAQSNPRRSPGHRDATECAGQPEAA